MSSERLRALLADPRGTKEQRRRALRDLTGERFGELVVERLEIVCKRQGRIWLCRCDCGRSARRSTANLLRGQRERAIACCLQCFREYRAGWLIAAYRERLALYRDIWERWQTLWTAAEEEALTSEIRDDVGKELGGWDDTPTLPLEAEEPSQRSGTNSDYYASTYEEIGKALGVSRERARQIEQQALSKMRLRLSYIDSSDHVVSAEAIDAAIERANEPKPDPVPSLWELLTRKVA